MLLHISVASLTSFAAPSTESLTPTRTYITAFGFAKMQPRGATEREDHSGLRAFLNSNPAKPEDKAHTHAPKSGFDWDNNSDGNSSPQVRNSHLRSLQRVTRRWQAAGGSKSKPSDGMFGTGLSVDAWMESAQKYAEGRRSEAQTTNGTEMDQMTSGDLENGSPTGYGCLPIRRKSVLKLFDDPVWSNGDGEFVLVFAFIDSHTDGGLLDVAQAIASGVCEVKDAGSNDQDAVAGTLSKFTAQRSRSGGTPTAASSTFSDSPTKGEAKVDWFFGPGEVPNGFRHMDWNRHGRGLSAVNAPECAPSVSRVLDAKESEGLSEKQLAHKSSKTSMIKRLKSQLFEATGALTSADPESQEDAIANLRFNGLRVSLDDKVRRFNNDLDSPTRDEKRLIYVPRVGVYSSVSAVAEARGYKRDPKWSPPTRSTSISGGTKTPPLKGYPTGPEDPNWDDAVKRVKRIVQEREKREAEEACQQQKELKIQEKKLKRLKAGKDVLIRGSQLGLTPKKPLDEMTEDEFEAVGAFATTPAKETSIAKKSGIFSTLFTKILGTTQEKEEHIEKIKLKLERHKSLELLNMASVEDVKELSLEDRIHFEKTLRALNGEGSPFAVSPGSDGGNSTSDDKNRTTAGTLEENVAVPNDVAIGSVRLGITADTPGRASERQKSAKNMSYQEFVALKRWRQNLDSQGENTQSIHDGPALSDIAEEDVESHAARGNLVVTKLKLEEEHEDDDRSSWCTESIYSIVEIEKMNDFGGLSVQYRASSRGSAPEVDQCLNVGGHTTPQFSESYAPFNLPNDTQDDDAASNYSDKIELDAMPAPLNLRVLKVKQSSTHVQPAHPNSFIPDREASFHARIQEASRLQEAHIGSRSHPALRTTPVDDKDAKSAEHPPNVQHCENGVDSKPKHDSLDSGIGSMSNEQLEQVDEGYATGNVKQNEFLSNEGPKTPSSKSNRSTQHWEGGSTAGESGETVDDGDLGALRTDVGLGPLRLASWNSSPKHPHHPFTWNHEKIMCRQIHNPMEVLPQMPSLPRSAPVSVSRMDSDYFNSSPTKSATGEPNMCQSCGSLCCRFANLLVTSKISTGGDIMEEMVRTKAQQRVNMLRTYHPNGIEEYETFIQCAQCGHHVCPKCSKKCTEQLCQSIVCADCRAQNETCPMHQ